MGPAVHWRPPLHAAVPKDGKYPRAPRAKSVIYIFLSGGLAQHESFDLKPNAPKEVRGEFKPISTSVPGLQISEYLPHTARIMHKVAVVRGMHHTMRFHDSASYQTLTGRVSLAGDTENFGERPDSFPSYGTCLSYARRNRRIVVPHASLPFVMNNNFSNPGQTSGFLGPVFQPLLISGDPQQLAYRTGRIY